MNRLQELGRGPAGRSRMLLEHALVTLYEVDGLDVRHPLPNPDQPGEDIPGCISDSLWWAATDANTELRLAVSGDPTTLAHDLTTRAIYIVQFMPELSRRTSRSSSSIKYVLRSVISTEEADRPNPRFYRNGDAEHLVDRWGSGDDEDSEWLLNTVASLSCAAVRYAAEVDPEADLAGFVPGL